MWDNLDGLGLSLQAVTAIAPSLLQNAFRILLAISLWLGGRKAIVFGVEVLQRSLHSRKTDPTLVRYACSAVNGLATVALVIVILGQFGVETTSFAALLGGIGLAIGAAWGGLLGHLAAGLFLLGLRPFKVGDAITAAGVTGVVKEIGLFGTEIDTIDNVQTIIGNNKIFSETIQNYTANGTRCLVLPARFDVFANPEAIIEQLLSAARELPGVLETPAPTALVGEVSAMRMRIDVTVWCNNADLPAVKHGFFLAVREQTLSQRGDRAIARPAINQLNAGIQVLSATADKQFEHQFAGR